MDFLICKTNISTNKDVEKLELIFDDDIVKDWSVDIEDIDNVLRVASTGKLTNTAIIELVNELGFLCEELPD